MTASAPILVTGSHRSGTTWVGRLLSCSGEMEPVHEPFNPALYRSWLARPPARWFEHVADDGGAVAASDVERVLQLRPQLRPMLHRASTARERTGAVREWSRAQRGRALGRQALLKDPIAFFSAEWLAERFGVLPVVLIRHPAAFCGSLKRLGWTFDFRNLASQPDLVRRYLRPFREELDAAVAGDLDELDRAVLLWRMITGTALEYGDRHRDWIVVRYEDLAADPMPGFRNLYGSLGLRWSVAVEAQVAAYTAPENGADVPDGDRGGVRRDSHAAMWTWRRRLEDAEVARIRAGTRDVARGLYDDADWAPATG